MLGRGNVMNNRQTADDFLNKSISPTVPASNQPQIVRRRKWILELTVAGIVLGLLLPLFPAVASQKKDAEYAVYLSPGRDSNIPWNGYHVSVTGFSKANAPHEKNMKSMAEAWHGVFKKTPYHFSKPTDKSKKYQFRDPTPKDGWRVDFKSDALDELERFLEKKGFDRVGSTRHKPYWHISLYGKSEHDAKKKFSELAEREWHLWLVEKDGAWKKIK